MRNKQQYLLFVSWSTAFLLSNLLNKTNKINIQNQQTKKIAVMLVVMQAKPFILNIFSCFKVTALRLTF